MALTIKTVDLKNGKIVHDGCMITVSGVVINLFNPDPELILIDDIAHGLANNSRWNGHTKIYWSIAQHCCMMADAAPAGEELKYLFHDVEEAYWGDIIKPLKNIIQESCPELIDRMNSLRKMIYEKFGIDYIDEKVHSLDYHCLIWEFENIVKKDNADYWFPGKAEREWLSRYIILSKK
jgi:hypothetical protein